MPIIGTPTPQTPLVYNWKSAKLQTKTQLKEYILSRLGAPVINIELVDDQLNHAIDDTIDQYVQKAYAGVVERHVPLTLLKGISKYILPYDVYAVLAVDSTMLGGIGNSSPSNIFSLNQFVAADLYRGSGKIDMLTYEMTNQMLATLEIEFSRKITFDFNCISKELSLFEIPVDDDRVMLRLYKKNYPEYDDNGVENTNIFSELWIRKMSTERARYQWASNLSKYNGTSLPGGLIIDVPTLLTEAKENIEKLEEELDTSFQLPIDFIIG